MRCMQTNLVSLCQVVGKLKDKSCTSWDTSQLKSLRVLFAQHCLDEGVLGRKKWRKGKETQKGKNCIITHMVSRFVCRHLLSKPPCRCLALHTCLSYILLLEQSTGSCTEYKNHSKPYSQAFNFESD